MKLLRANKQVKEVEANFAKQYGISSPSLSLSPSVQQPDTSSGSGKDATDSNLGKLFE
jgi:hypothetical protein